MLKHWRVELTGLLVLLGAGLLWAQEQVTLTTYYPSPRGVYREVRVGSGIATTPAARLHVVKPEDDGDFAFRVDDELDFSDDDTSPFVIDEEGRVIIGATTGNPDAKLSIRTPAVTTATWYGVDILNGNMTSGTSVALRGAASLTSGTVVGLRGEASATGGTVTAVSAEATTTSGTAYALYGEHTGTGGTAYGVYGTTTGTSGTRYGVYGDTTTNGGTAYGGYFTSTAGSGDAIGGYFSASSSSGNAYGLLVENGNVGIGTTSPTAALTLVDGTILAQGSPAGVPAPVSGAGTRLMWLPSQHAFRAGQVTGTEWDTANIGLYSIAMGIDTMASNWASIAIGAFTTASGWNSMALGHDTTASGLNSVAIGSNGTTASGDHSLALGYNIEAAGDHTVAVSLSLVPYTVSQANTMAIMGGNVGIGTTTPISLLHVAQDAGAVPPFGFQAATFNNSSAVGDDVSVALISGASGNARLYFGHPTIINRGIVEYDHSNERMHFYVGQSLAMTIERAGVSGGNVGIGTTSPTERLHVDAAGGNIRLETLETRITTGNFLCIDSATGVVYRKLTACNL